MLPGSLGPVEQQVEHRDHCSRQHLLLAGSPEVLHCVNGTRWFAFNQYRHGVRGALSIRAALLHLFDAPTGGKEQTVH